MIEIKKLLDLNEDWWLALWYIEDLLRQKNVSDADFIQFSGRCK